MADRATAQLFGGLFEWLTAAPIDGLARRVVAEHLWWTSRGYDFCDEQMCATEALGALGLAREVNSEVEWGPLCDKCGKRLALPPHTCPYAEEMYDDARECTCCKECMADCAEEV